MLWVRSLQKDEITFFQKSNTDFDITNLGPLSIMGPESLYIMKFLNVEREYFTERIGDNAVLTHQANGGIAEGGKKIPINWGIESAMLTLNKIATQLNIPTLYKYPENVIYFQSIYSDAFLDSFAAIDIDNYINNASSFFSINRDNSKEVIKSVQNILISARNRYNNN